MSNQFFVSNFKLVKKVSGDVKIVATYSECLDMMWTGWDYVGMVRFPATNF